MINQRKTVENAQTLSGVNACKYNLFTYMYISNKWRSCKKGCRAPFSALFNFIPISRKFNIEYYV